MKFIAIYRPPFFRCPRVREMDDDAAYMALVTSNTQGELTPLEIGMHALECVEKAQGKRGGGLTEYAKAIGKSQPAVSQFRAAAEVYSQLHKLTNEVGTLTNKATHLFELHAAPRETWPLLVEAMLSADWSVKDTHYNVEQVLRFFEKDETGEITASAGSVFSIRPLGNRAI